MNDLEQDLKTLSYQLTGADNHIKSRAARISQTPINNVYWEGERGASKCYIIGHEMVRFINAMMELKDVDYQDKYIPDKYKKMFKSENILTLREETLEYCFNIKKCAPSLLIEIICINKRAKTMLMNAKSDRNVAEIKIAQLETEVEKMNMIVDLSRQIDRFLRSILRQVRNPLTEMECIIENNKSWKSMRKEDKTVIASLIYIAHVNSVTVSECKFKGCSINCIKLSDGEVRAKANIKNCTFDNCIVPKSYDHNDEKNVLTSFRFILRLEKCKFNKIYGVNINAQLVRNEVIACKFTNCKKDALGEGFLSILVDVDEPIIMVKDCVFEKCINEDRYKPDSSGILYLYSGLVEKCNKETVLIDNCEFIECEAVKQIRGVEKQDGFFGSSVKLYKFV